MSFCNFVVAFSLNAQRFIVMQKNDGNKWPKRRIAWHVLTAKQSFRQPGLLNNLGRRQALATLQLVYRCYRIPAAGLPAACRTRPSRGCGRASRHLTVTGMVYPSDAGPARAAGLPAVKS